MTRFLALLLLLLAALPARAQDAVAQSPEEERSLFTSFVENQLSTPNRQIRISGIQGALSSEATIGQITIADREGVWLRITNAVIDWNRSALILRQRLEIERLAAESIEVYRRPLPAEGISPEARSFSVPELPVAINLEQLEVPRIAFDEDVFGLASVIAVQGSLLLEGGSLDTALEIERLDGPGGHLSLQAAYANETDRLDLDLTLDEPENGVVANLLNIEGRPPLSLTLSGAGPVENLDLSLSLAAAGEPVLTGTARFRERPEGLGFTVDVDGQLATLVPARFRDFFGDESTLRAEGVAKSGGGLLLERLTVASAALDLEAAAETAPDGFPTALSLEARIADPRGERVLLPVSGGETAVQSATLTATYGEAGAEMWRAVLDMDGLTTATFAAQSADLTLEGRAENLSAPTRRSITYTLDGAVTGITAERADVAEALGDSLTLSAEGSWRAGAPLAIDTAQLAGHSFAASLSGIVADFAFNGDINAEAENIAPFSGLAGRDLSGSIDLVAEGELRPISGAFDLELNGRAEELRIGEPAVAPLLAGITRITGRLARGAEGFAAEDFRVVNEQMELTADGTFSSEAADFGFDAAIADLALVTDRAEGRLTTSGRAAGSAGELSLALTAAVPSGRLLDKRLTEAELTFEGTLQDDALAGLIEGEAFLDGVRAALRADLVLSAGERRLTGIEFTAGGARLTGEVLQNREGLLDGALSLQASEISTAAALFLVEAQGAVEAEVALEPREDTQYAQLDARLSGVVAEGFSLESAEVEAEVDDLFGVPAIEGSLRAAGLKAAGIDVETLAATAQTEGEATAFTAQATLTNGTEIATRGRLAPEDGGFVVALEEATLEQAGISARLLQPARLNVAGETVTFQPVMLDIAGGRVTAEGEIGEVLDVALSLDSVPLSIANTIRPDLELGGTVSGEATVAGTREEPQVSFTLTGRGISAAALSQAGIASLNVDATGRTRGDVLTVEAEVASPRGFRATAAGRVPLGTGELALDVDVQAFPLSLLNAPLPGQELGGEVTGTARVTGTLARPRAEFTLRTGGFTARPLAEFGLGPLAATASGSFAEGTVVLQNLEATGPSGLSISASGRIPLQGGGLAVDARGTFPLSLANRLLRDRGTQVTGTGTADIRITGSLANPAVSGTLSTADAAVFDPMTNLRLASIRIEAGLEGDRIVVRSASAALARGGTVALSGTISLSGAAGFPADLTLRLEDAQYSDGELVTATLDGTLTLQGPLARDPLLSGEVLVDRAEIIVPSDLGGGPGAVEVEHVNPPPGVQRTLARARADDGTPTPSGRPSVLRLDLTINAPQEIFVRGRGLDAELGGQVQLRGPITSIEPVGGFRLIRGRLSILAQRITFDTGTVTLVGDLDPYLDFVARSERSDITVFITVTGRVSDLDVNFSSQPELPEDEVLARLLFNRGLNELSPLQIAQLAAAAAELAGGRDTSLLGSLREAVGLDDLDIVTDAEGNVAVRAGRYIRENVYVGVEAGAGGTTRATINLDITEDLKARGAVGTEGQSSLGIFYEKDY